MRIAFITTLSLTGSTNRGRVIPLARELSARHDIHILALKPQPSSSPPSAPEKITAHFVGYEPFTRAPNGKNKLTGFKLLTNMTATAWHVFRTLSRLKPDRVVIVKPLPHNTCGVLLWHWFKRLHTSVILDADDFELSANQTTSQIQRFAIHWSERAAVSISDHIVTATPFLNDHFQFLKPGADIHTIPTGINPTPASPARPLTPPVISYFGSLSRSSGHRVDMLPHILKDLIQTHPEAKLLVSGAGDDESFLRQEFSRLQLNDHVIWHGPFHESDIPTLLNKTSIILDPVGSSVTERAKSSFRAVLAAVSGTPVVTSNIGIRTEIIPAALHSRFFAKPADPADYARKISGLIQAPLSDQDQHALIQHGQSYTWPRLAVLYETVIKLK